MGVSSPPSSPRRAGAAHPSTSSTSIGLVLAGVACLAAVAVGSFGLTTEATLGIDLGTTFSVAATCERGIVTVVRVPGGSGTRDAETMPSVVYFPERADEAAVVGADAAMRRATHPRRVVYDAKRIIIATTHGVFSGPAIDRIKNAPVETVLVTDTLPLPSEKRADNITVLSVAPIIAQAISAVFEDTSVSEIFQGNHLA